MTAKQKEAMSAERKAWWKRARALLKKWKEAHPDQRYLPYIPKKVPEGFVIVHNPVTAKLQPGEPQETRYPGWRSVGQGGFRIWKDRPSPDYEECGCGWASHLGVHYRVKRDEKEAA